MNQAKQVGHTPGPFANAIAALEAYVNHEPVEMCAMAEALEQLRVAPEMLEALKRSDFALSLVRPGKWLDKADVDGALKVVQVAIAKAEGR